LDIINKAYTTHEWLCKAFTPGNVLDYYTATTDREYRWLEAVVGAGMHTRLHSPHVRVSQVDFVVREMAMMGAKEVLEVGCGKGACTFHLASLFPSAKFHAVDPLSRHVDIANLAKRDARVANAAFYVGSLDAFTKQLPNKVDLIFAVEALCYVEGKDGMALFLRQAAWCLSPSGRLVIADAFRPQHLEIASAHQRVAMRLAESGLKIRRAPTRREWEVAAANAGLVLRCHQDLTAEALHAWTALWRAARCLVRIPGLARCLPAHSAGNLLTACTAAHALRGKEAAEYGVLVFVRH